MEVKKDVEVVSSSDPYYDFFDGGYIEPENMLVDEDDILRVKRARNVIEAYFMALEESGKLELF
jgi:hypothetical protein